MHDLSPGQEVYSYGLPATVVYVRGESVRVRMAVSGRERTVPLHRVTPKRESKALIAGKSAGLVIYDEIVPSNIRDLVVVSGGAVERFERLRPVPKPATLRSNPYLAYVRKHPCCLCGASPSEAHHWSHHGGVMGAKVDDYRTVPLCQEHHRYWHDHGTLPGMDRDTSEQALLREQAWLLRAWFDNETPNYGDMVDALIRAIGGAGA